MAIRKEIPPSISHMALLEKSKVFIKRSLTAKANVDLAEYQLWGSLALELLAKAALAAVHPSLIVDTKKNENALLNAAGIEVIVRVATISADAAYIRLKHVAAPRFNNHVYEACKGMADLRNVHLHSGELPFEGRPNNVWEGGFWHACEIILEAMNSNLDEWIGVSPAKETRNLIRAVSEAKYEAAKRRIIEAKERFEEQFPKQTARTELITKSHAKPPLYKHLRLLLDRHWTETCPACESSATVGGDKIYECLSDEQTGAEEGYEFVDLTYSIEELYCQTCGLRLEGEDDLRAGEIEIVSHRYRRTSD